MREEDIRKFSIEEKQGPSVKELETLSDTYEDIAVPGNATPSVLTTGNFQTNAFSSQDGTIILMI